MLLSPASCCYASSEETNEGSSTGVPATPQGTWIEFPIPSHSVAEPWLGQDLGRKPGDGRLLSAFQINYFNVSKSFGIRYNDKHIWKAKQTKRSLTHEHESQILHY